MDYEKFEAIAVDIKERETKLLCDKAEHAAVAVADTVKVADGQGNATRSLASLWGRSTAYVHTLARVWEEIGPGLIFPDVPLSIYRAALDAADLAEDLASASVWLRYALLEGWSSRQLRDAAGLVKGKHLSDVTFQGQADITEWDVPAGRFTAVGLPLSGEKPEQAMVTIREVLGR